MLDLCECNVMKELDKKLAGNICLVAGKAFDSNENGRSGNDKGIEGVDLRCQEKTGLNGLRVRWGCMGRFVRGRGQEVGHGKKELVIEQQ